MNERQYRFEWDDAKAAANVRKHGVPFRLAGTIFRDPHVFTVADLEHSETEERWFSVGCASNGTMLSVAYVRREVRDKTEVRIISARKATMAEIRRYLEGL